MTQEEKHLLFVDLSARTPYKVIVRHADCIIDENYNETGDFAYTRGCLYDVCGMDDMTTTIIESEGEREGYEHICDLEKTVPYLRSLSSMTEEEKKELLAIVDEESKEIIEQLKNEDCGIMEGKYHFNSLKEFDWLNAHHFDYRGLIPMGLAIEAPEGMYNK